MIQSINIGYNKGSGIMMKLSKSVATAVITTSFILVSGCSGGGMFDCERQLRSSTISPDGKFKVGVLTVQCGATTADATWIILADGGNNYDYDRDQIAVFEGTDVKAEWQGGGVEVTYHDARSFRMDPISRGVSIKYRHK